MIGRTGVLRVAAASSVIGAGLLFGGDQAAAAPAFSITTSPVSVDLAATPGKTTTTKLQVMNNNPTPVQVSLELDSFSANGTTGQANVTPLSPSDPAAGYVHFSQSTFTAQPGVFTPITMTIKLPISASLGYYYAVLFKPILPTSSAPHTSTIKGSNAVLVLLDTHSGNEQRQLQVSSFTTTKKLYQYLPVNFNVTVHNNGNIYLPPTGDIFISKSSTFGKIIDTLPVNKGGGNVLPESVRIFSVTWSDGFPVYQTKTAGGQPVTKNGKPVQHVHWDFTQLNKLRIGKYYAHLALVYNNGTQDIPVDGVVSFWVVPWKILGIIIVIGLLVLFGLFTLVRAIVKRARSVTPKHSRRGKI